MCLSDVKMTGKAYFTGKRELYQDNGEHIGSASASFKKYRSGLEE